MPTLGELRGIVKTLDKYPNDTEMCLTGYTEGIDDSFTIKDISFTSPKDIEMGIKVKPLLRLGSQAIDHLES